MIQSQVAGTVWVIIGSVNKRCLMFQVLGFIQYVKILHIYAMSRRRSDFQKFSKFLIFKNILTLIALIPWLRRHTWRGVDFENLISDELSKVVR